MAPRLSTRKIVLTLLPSVLIIYGCNGLVGGDVSYEKVIIIGETAESGVFDPSLEYDGTTGWLAYSAVDVPEYVHTHLARSADGGRSWEYVTEINRSEAGTVVDGKETIDGIWRHEVPTLVHDPGDPGREWKLYWHRYFVRPPYKAEDRLFEYGWVAYKYASSPDGLWSEEVALFGAYPYPSGGFEVEHYLNQLHPDLADFVAFTEPGSLYKNGVLYLSFVGAHPGGEGMFKTFLIRSGDHGTTWEDVGTLTDGADATELGYTMLTAPSLVEKNGRVFLLAAPWGPLFTDHDGTYVFEFEDITQAKLKRNGGKLVVIKYLPPSLSGWINAGESDYDAGNTYGGILMPQLDMADPNSFAIYNTKEYIIE